MDNTIEAHGLVKRFGDTTALDGVDPAARTGSVLAVLGPNGAGKTTAVRILATLLEPDEGRALVGGYDVVARAQQVRQLIALTGQYAAVDERLTGIENLLLIGRLLGQSRAAARGRAAELLAQFSLADAGGRQDLLGGHAAPARPGRQPGRPAPGAVPGRADHRPRPARPERPVGGCPGPHERRRRWPHRPGPDPATRPGPRPTGPRARSGSQPSCWRPARASASKRTASTASASTASR